MIYCAYLFKSHIVCLYCFDAVSFICCLAEFDQFILYSSYLWRNLFKKDICGEHPFSLPIVLTAS